MQLVAYGAQDLSYWDPQITFFKVVYADDFTNFSMESIEQIWGWSFYI